MKKLFIIGGLSVCTLLSCNDDIVSGLTKKGSIETVIAVDHLNHKQDIIRTTYRVWKDNQLIQVIEKADTIESLGITRTQAENDLGDVRQVEAPREYELYITVK